MHGVYSTDTAAPLGEGSPVQGNGSQPPVESRTSPFVDDPDQKAMGGAGSNWNFTSRTLSLQAPINNDVQVRAQTRTDIKPPGSTPEYTPSQKRANDLLDGLESDLKVDGGTQQTGNDSQQVGVGSTNQVPTLRDINDKFQAWEGAIKESRDLEKKQGVANDEMQKGAKEIGDLSKKRDELKRSLENEKDPSKRSKIEGDLKGVEKQMSEAAKNFKSKTADVRNISQKVVGALKNEQQAKEAYMKAEQAYANAWFQANDSALGGTEKKQAT